MFTQSKCTWLLLLLILVKLFSIIINSSAIIVLYIITITIVIYCYYYSYYYSYILLWTICYYFLLFLLLLLSWLLVPWYFDCWTYKRHSGTGRFPGFDHLARPEVLDHSTAGAPRRMAKAQGVGAVWTPIQWTGWRENGFTTVPSGKHTKS